MCYSLVSDPVYQANFQAAFRARSLEPQIEMLLIHYAFGKPSQTLGVNMNFDLARHLAALTPDPDDEH